MVGVGVRLYWGGCAAGCFCLGLHSSMLKLENGFLLKLLWHDLTYNDTRIYGFYIRRPGHLQVGLELWGFVG